MRRFQESRNSSYLFDKFKHHARLFRYTCFNKPGSSSTLSEVTFWSILFRFSQSHMFGKEYWNKCLHHDRKPNIYSWHIFFSKYICYRLLWSNLANNCLYGLIVNSLLIQGCFGKQFIKINEMRHKLITHDFIFK